MLNLSESGILKYAVSELENVGFVIEKQKEISPKTRFFDIGAIIYYAKACPWQIPDFSLEDCLEQMKKLHEQILKKGFLEVTSERFFIKARKPK